MSPTDLYALFAPKLPSSARPSWRDRALVSFALADDLGVRRRGLDLNMISPTAVLPFAACGFGLSLLADRLIFAAATMIICSITVFIGARWLYLSGRAIDASGRPVTVAQLMLFSSLTPPNVWQAARSRLEADRRSLPERPLSFSDVRSSLKRAAVDLAQQEPAACAAREAAALEQDLALGTLL